MDKERFDDLVRRLNSGLTRRGAVGSALGGLAAAAGLGALPEAEGKGKGKGKKAKGKAGRKKGRTHAETCGGDNQPAGCDCTNDNQCASDECCGAPQKVCCAAGYGCHSSNLECTPRVTTAPPTTAPPTTAPPTTAPPTTAPPTTAPPTTKPPQICSGTCSESKACPKIHGEECVCDFDHPKAKQGRGRDGEATGVCRTKQVCVRDPKSCKGKPCDAVDNCGHFCGCGDKDGVCCSDGICRVPPTCSSNGESGLCCSGHQCGNGVCCAAGNSLASSIVVDVDVFNTVTVNTPPTTVTVTITPGTTVTPGGAGRRRTRRRRNRRRKH